MSFQASGTGIHKKMDPRGQGPRMTPIWWAFIIITRKNGKVFVELIGDDSGGATDNSWECLDVKDSSPYVAFEVFFVDIFCSFIEKIALKFGVERPFGPRTEADLEEMKKQNFLDRKWYA